MEPQGRENVPARHTPERNKRLGLRKTTLASRESARSNSWAECRDTKKFRHRAEGEIFLLTFPFIGPSTRRATTSPSRSPRLPPRTRQKSWPPSRGKHAARCSFVTRRSYSRVNSRAETAPADS